jgi:uncharacterized protein (TIGR00251 family)
VEKKTTLEVHVQPGAKSNEMVGLRDGVLWVRVMAPPHKGQANQELLALIAQALVIAKNDVALIRGHTSRHKLMAIKGLSSGELEERLAQALSGEEPCRR